MATTWGQQVWQAMFSLGESYVLMIFCANIPICIPLVTKVIDGPQLDPLCLFYKRVQQTRPGYREVYLFIYSFLTWTLDISFVIRLGIVKEVCEFQQHGNIWQRVFTVSPTPSAFIAI